MIDLQTEKTHLILASSSPRRAELLREAGYSFEVIAPSFDEPDDMAPDVPPHARAEALSFFKARGVMKSGARGLLLAADTVVAYEGKVFGKPDDMEDARRILRALSGTTHQVVTGVTLLDTDSEVRIIAHDTTAVTMRPLSHNEIEVYLYNGGWEGKAGAYGAQSERDPCIEKIEGSFTNVVGLPMELLTSMLIRHSADAESSPIVETESTSARDQS